MVPELEVVIEVPRGSFLKRGSTGRVDFVSPLPCPYNYGSVPQYIGLEERPARRPGAGAFPPPRRTRTGESLGRNHVARPGNDRRQARLQPRTSAAGRAPRRPSILALLRGMQGLAQLPAPPPGAQRVRRMARRTRGARPRETTRCWLEGTSDSLLIRDRTPARRARGASSSAPCRSPSCRWPRSPGRS